MKSNSICVPTEKKCSFCSYLRKDRPYTILYRNELVAILVTKEQRGEPHLLIIPCAHRETVLDLTDKEMMMISILLKKVAKAIVKAYKSEGISIWQNNGIPASQSIPHMHFHIAGTLKGGGTDWGDVPELTLDETQQIANKINIHLHLT
ncbi:MAG: HIT family protein [Pantoea ananatis]|uniref:HIT family protein n=1 Tax=Pantoea TaxID=53335 RepID=UPI0005B26C7C|nr:MULTISPECIES: HIT family protein [Pantoea]MCS4493428.1 HIT family protein [Pantoea sp. B623]NEK81292.1 HIT family protein [Pantoea ananatis]REF11793.1 histidine triad (HIT) family protein [Pantoea ananatis]